MPPSGAWWIGGNNGLNAVEALMPACRKGFVMLVQNMPASRNNLSRCLRLLVPPAARLAQRTPGHALSRRRRRMASAEVHRRGPGGDEPSGSTEGR